jgi:hypothetical protein
VWYHWPAKLSSPGRVGTLVEERQPTAGMKNCARNTSPLSVVIVQRSLASSKRALETRVPSWMSGISLSRSATYCRYRRISPCSGYRSVHSHSCSSSREKE